jgi:hypothetical protein
MTAGVAGAFDDFRFVLSAGDLWRETSWCALYENCGGAERAGHTIPASRAVASKSGCSAMAKGTRIYLVVFSDVLPLVKGSRVKTFEVPGSTFDVPS